MSQSKKVKIIIATINEKGDWFNITDNEDVEYGVNKTKNKALAKQLAGAVSGDEIEANLWTSDNGKNFLFDPSDNKSNSKSGGGKSYAPRDKSFEAAIAAANVAATMLSMEKLEEKHDLKNNFKPLFETVHSLIMEKASK